MLLYYLTCPVPCNLIHLVYGVLVLHCYTSVYSECNVGIVAYQREPLLGNYVLSDFLVILEKPPKMINDARYLRSAILEFYACW